MLEEVEDSDRPAKDVMLASAQVDAIYDFKDEDNIDATTSSNAVSLTSYILKQFFQLLNFHRNVTKTRKV